MQHRELNASVTVEAAYVIPIVMMVVFGMIMLTFYLYNRIRLTVDADRCAEYILTRGLDEEEAKEEAEKWFNRYFAAEAESVEVYVSEDSVSVSAGVRSTIDTKGMSVIPSDMFRRITYTATAVRHDRCLKMRRYRAGEDALNLAEKVIDGSTVDQ